MKALNLVTFIIGSALSLSASANHTHVSSIVANGSGCAMVTPRVATQGQTIHIITKQLRSALIDGDRFDRQNCQVSLNIAPLPGHYYEIDQIRINGYANLTAKAQGNVLLATYFQGDSQSGNADLTLNGSHRGPYTLINKVPLRSSCEGDRALNINTAVRLLDRTGTAVSNSYLRANSRVSMRIIWKPCE